MVKAEHLDPYKWKKGQSGNPSGRPKVKTLPEYAREYLEEIDPETGQPRIVGHAQQWVEESIATPALFLSLLDRLYGKVTDKLDVTSGGKSMAELLNALKTPSGHGD